MLCLLMCGCGPSTKYTTQQEVVRSWREDSEKGWVRDIKANYKIEWESEQ